MKERVRIVYSSGFEGLIREKGLTPLSFIQQALKLGLLVEQGAVFQAVGGELCRLKMTDFTPYPSEIGVKMRASPICFEVPDDVVGEIKKTSSLKIPDWVSRAVSLRLLAENLDLRMFADDNYVRISFEKEESPSES
jgi:hypothetical protein